MPEFIEFDNSDPSQIVCVFGSGDMKGNYLCQRRVEVALDIPLDKKILIFFGRHQPSMLTPQTEAQAMQQYAHRHYLQSLSPAPGLVSILRHAILEDDDTIASTSDTCYVIARQYLTLGDHVHLVTNWLYLPRAYYLLRKQALHAGIDWRKARKQVHLVWCGGVFWPYFYHQGLRALPRLVTAPGREVGAWLKALADPYSKKYNQKRTF